MIYDVIVRFAEGVGTQKDLFDALQKAVDQSMTAADATDARVVAVFPEATGTDACLFAIRSVRDANALMTRLIEVPGIKRAFIAAPRRSVHG